jgi:hypothetical protein
MRADAVKGRLPHGWKIESALANNILRITAPYTGGEVSITINTLALHEYSPTHTLTTDKLKTARVMAKYDSETGVVRFDSEDIPEFWLEVNTKLL